eukprot:TRINITY_DN21452_c0_g1_i1.p1 TRINITY_DN21452_c0_g1~~TRINITY_DN21452_c0_g1_i1.p1  ORF type:complete len:362 (+),score=73.45 TRINITY_DN21452_c0_g1_i1:122-1087(+)
MKAPFHKECKICARPFTVFRWKPGTNARYKKTEICQTCAKVKNVCQTCLLDLEFGLPVQVRDQALGQDSAQITVSDVGREWQATMNEKELAETGNNNNAYGRSKMKGQLQKMVREGPYHKRNEAHVCSFFLKGTCNRGASCPYKHEKPEQNKDPALANQNIKDRYNGVNDPVAKKIMNRMNEHHIAPPADRTITTLYLGNVGLDTTEQDLRDVLYAYGEIKAIKIVTKQNCAFVSFLSRDSAEKAAEALYGNFKVKENEIRVSWGKPQSFDGQSSQKTEEAANNYFSTPSQVQMPPPPNPRLATPSYPSMNPQRFGTKRDR